MNTALYSETLAELNAMLDALPAEDEPDLQSLIDALDAIDRIAAPSVIRPEIVATSIICDPVPAQENKEDAASDVLRPQCADPTFTPHPHHRSNTSVESDNTSAESMVTHHPQHEPIPNISDLWASGKSSYTLVKEFLAQVKSKVELADADEEAIAHNLDRLFDLRKYPFTALEIASSVDEEQVADIFVRINSKGVPLNQADFILTLLSVFWEDGRRDLETFCHAARTKATIGGKGSPFHHLIAPDPDQLLRVSIAFGFGRGRLKSVYQILRGKDAETGEFTSDTRLMAQVLPFEIAARELRVAPSIVREASGADGRIAFGDAVAAVVAYHKGRIAGGDAAIDAALTPTRRGPRPGLYGTPLRLRRLRTDAARAAAPLVDQIDRRMARLVALAHAQAPDQPAEAKRAASIARKIDGLAAALAKRNARALRGLGPKEVKT